MCILNSLGKLQIDLIGQRERIRELATIQQGLLSNESY